MKFKRLTAILLSAVIAVCVCGCSKPELESEQTESSNSETSDIPSDTVEANNSTEESEPAHQNDEMNIISAKDLVKQMRVGWNLGNTLDATGGSGVTAETSWGNTVTSKLMIDKIKEAGFNVLRVPVSWGTHLDEDYNIDPAWMDRVQEVVNYGIDNEMFVILNTHHEEWYMPVEEDVEEDLVQLEAVWKQIAERFKGYNEKLIFEGVNEPRLRGQGAEWNGTSSARDIVNRYAETFVRTVRASGGNNAERCIMVTPYAASSSAQNLRALVIPENSGNVIVSVHAYLPYSLALDTTGTDVYDPNDTSIRDLFKNIQSIFLDNDIPVIIGEFGVVNKENTEDRVRCVTDYLTMAKEHGVPCVWWDNGAYRGNGENFGLFNRREYTWYSSDVLEAIQKATAD